MIRHCIVHHINQEIFFLKACLLWTKAFLKPKQMYCSHFSMLQMCNNCKYFVTGYRRQRCRLRRQLVYVKWANKNWSSVNFVTIFCDLYKFKLWGICNNFNQFTHLSSAPGPSNDIIKKWPSHNYNVYVFKKNQSMFDRFNAGTPPDFKQTHFYTKIYFKM